MSIERDELTRLVPELPDEQVPSALAELRKYVQVVPERPWPPAWFGIVAGDGTAVGAAAKSSWLRASVGNRRACV